MHRWLWMALLGAGCPSGIIDDDEDGFTAEVDCNDQDASINQDAEEVCDGVDNDCSGAVDDNATDATTYYVDADLDGFAGSDTVEACEQPPDTYEGPEDCDDSNDAIHPGVAEVLDDGIDQDCSGADRVAVEWGLSDDAPRNSAHGDGFLLGQSIAMRAASEITGLGFFAKGESAGAYLALYSDNGGEPQTLLATSERGTVVAGENVFAIDPLELDAGTYWLMTMFEQGTDLAWRETGDVTIHFVALPWRDNPPETFPVEEQYAAPRFSLFLRGSFEAE